MTQFPPLIKDFIGEGDKRPGTYGPRTDPAKLLIARTRYERPSLVVPNGPRFEWPLGVEGVRISGAAGVAEQKFIGDNDPVLTVMHFDDQRITLTGQFPGFTGSQNMQDLLKVIRAPAGKVGKRLTLPSAVFATEIYGVVESYDFDHPEDDRTMTWTYSFTFRRQSVGKAVKKPKKVAAPVVPKSTKSKPKGKSARVFTVHSGANTLRAVAQIVYKNPNRWSEIYTKNKTKLRKLGVPLHLLPTKRLPLGMKLDY